MEGEGRPIVCFHGEPTWAFLYRKMLRPLVEAGYRVICPDLAGFGRSDKPTDRGWYSFERHSELIGALLAELDLRDAIVVVQDWGGPVGLTWAVENEDRVAGLVILNTGLFTGRVSKGFMAWRDFAEKNPDLPIGFVIQGGTAANYLTMCLPATRLLFQRPRRRPGPRSSLSWWPHLGGYPHGGSAAPGQGCPRTLGQARSGCVLRQRPGVPVSQRQRFTDSIPTAGEQVKIEGAAHFLQEDRGEQIAGEILRLLG